MEFDLSVLDNVGHGPQVHRHPMGPMGKLYTKFQVKNCYFAAGE